MPYKIRIRKNPKKGQDPAKGQKVGELGPFKSQADAVAQAQVLADAGVISRAHNILVEQIARPSGRTGSSRSSRGARTSNPKKKATSKKRKAKKKATRKKSTRTYKGHKIKGSKKPYKVEPYGYEFDTIKAAKAWVDQHVAAHSLRSNPFFHQMPTTGDRAPVKKRKAHHGVRRRNRGPIPKLKAGGLGGPDYTARSTRSRRRILSDVVETDGYRTALGRIQALLVLGKNRMSSSDRSTLEGDKRWLVATYGGPGATKRYPGRR